MQRGSLSESCELAVLSLWSDSDQASIERKAIQKESWGFLAESDLNSGAKPKSSSENVDRSNLEQIDPDPGATQARTAQVLKAFSFQVLKPDLGSGGEGVAMLTLGPDGNLYVAKGSMRNHERLKDEADLARKVWFHARNLESKPIVLKPIILEDDSKVPVLLTPYFPNEPGKQATAPTLEMRLKKQADPADELSIEARIKTIESIVDGVVQAHTAGVIHRDLKPSNILVDKSGDVRFIDWGIAAELNTIPRGSEGRITGTLAFMSENQIHSRPAKPVDDLTALRKMAWEILDRDGAAKGHTINRPVLGWRQIPDYAHAPELSGVDPKVAIAVWSRLPSTAVQYRDLLKSARTLSDEDFFLLYGKQLSSADKPSRSDYLANVAAMHILESKALIEQFPNGLGMDTAKRDAVIRAAMQMHQDTEDGTIALSGPHHALYYNSFFARLKTLGIVPQKGQIRFDPSQTPPRPTGGWLKTLKGLFDRR